MNRKYLPGYKADISTAQDYYPFGMLKPGRYVSDKTQRCVTINTTVLVPVREYPKLVAHGNLVNAYCFGCEPPPPSVFELAKASDFSHETLVIYHYNPGGQIATTEEVNGEITFNIDLSGEPSGVSAYLQLHADTAQTTQELGFNIGLPADGYAEVRVRQYYDSTVDEYYDAVQWTTIETSGPQQLLIPIDKQAVVAGGNTIMELRFHSYNGNFGIGIIGEVGEIYSWISHYVAQTRVATICDDKDNYRFGFNGMEKDNEVKGIGNSLDFGARIYDSRLGKFLSVDPDRYKYPYWSPYLFAANSPIRYIDIQGRGPGDVVVLMAGADAFGTGGLGSVPALKKQIEAYQKTPGTSIETFSSKYRGVTLKTKNNFDVATQAAYNYIKENHTEGGQVVIYGYSWGGALTSHLARRLQKDGIKVDLLVTVDAAGGSENKNVDRKIPSNVIRNINYYQSKPETIYGYTTGSHGDRNSKENANSDVEIWNDNRSGHLGPVKYQNQPAEEIDHGSIDEAVMPEAAENIGNTVDQPNNKETPSSIK